MQIHPLKPNQRNGCDLDHKYALLRSHFWRDGDRTQLNSLAFNRDSRIGDEFTGLLGQTREVFTMSTQLLLALAIATIASSFYRMLSEEVPRMMAAIVAIVCFLICLISAPLPVQLLIFFGLLSIYRHQPAV